MNNMIYRSFFKRIIDFSLAIVGLLVLSPLFILIFILLLIFNKGAGAFFTQERPGKNAKIFKVIKFKTMTDEKDDDGNLLSDSKRLTKLGKLIRSTSLDELPQLINILKGDMSLIGPRPLLPIYMDYYTSEEQLRHTVKPGVTGLAQVSGRNTISWDERLKLDVFYVRNISFALDLRIFLLTIKNVLSRKDIVIIPGEKFSPLHVERGYYDNKEIK